MKKVNLYLQIVVKEFKTRSVYTFASIVMFLSTIIIFSTKILLFNGLAMRGVFNNDQFNELVYYSFFVILLQNFFAFGLFNKNAELIKSGDIAYRFLKRIGAFKQSFFEVLGIKLYNFIFIVIPLYFLINFIFKFSFLKISSILDLIAFFLCYLFVILFELLLSSFTFFVMNSWGLNNIKNALMLILGGQMIPITYYPNVLQNVFNVLPFRYFFDVPISILSGEKLKIEEVMIMILWNMITYFLYRYVYQKGVERIVIQGG